MYLHKLSYHKCLRGALGCSGLLLCIDIPFNNAVLLCIISFMVLDFPLLTVTFILYLLLCQECFFIIHLLNITAKH
uniref:Uncharacterized protein n=1 Tax=Anguilla anguilla TaxID=7936 RepID=A0A0E9X3J6_ANGAN